MIHFNFVLLYVDSPAASEAFYAKLLGKAPLESSPTFAMFALGDDDALRRNESMFLGLWKRDTVAPAPQAAAGGSEFAFVVPTPDDVRRVHDEWRAKGVTILQTPVKMDFGTTFAAADPDGHRIRVFAREG